MGGTKTLVSVPFSNERGKGPINKFYENNFGRIAICTLRTLDLAVQKPLTPVIRRREDTS